MKTDAQQGIVLNVVVGIVGALLGGWLLAPLVRNGDYQPRQLKRAVPGSVVIRRRNIIGDR